MSSLTFRLIKILSTISGMDLRHINSEISHHLPSSANINQIDLRAYGIGNHGSIAETGEKYLVENILPQIIASKSPLIIDVGANPGSEKQYANLFRKVFPAATIIAFEPNPAAFKVLEKISPASAAQINEKLALGLKNGPTIHYTNQNQRYNELSGANRDFVKKFSPHGRGVKSYPVKQVTLDHYLSSKKIDQAIDFLKIDVEGYEWEVLAGSKKLIENNRIKNIQFEINEANILQRRFLKDFYGCLPGYKLFRLAEGKLIPLGKYSPENEYFRFQNIFATKSNLL